MSPVPFPRDPLQRARLAFLGLAVLALGSAGLQLLLMAEDAPVRAAAAVALLVMGGTWIRLYVTGRPAWWIDAVTAISLYLHAEALPLPDLGLALFYVALYIHAFYGTRLEAIRAGTLILFAYLTAEIRFGFYESEVLVPFVVFQVPALLITGGILRALYESLLSRKELARELERMIRMEAVTRLTGGIAHDFNNLLTAITGSLDLALAEMDEDHPSRADVTLARETADRAGSLTRQLLSFSRNAIVRPEPVEVDAALRSMDSLLDHLAGDGVTLEMDLRAGDAFVLIDPPSFEQVLTNLVVNAAEAMDAEGEGEGPASVRIATRRIPGREMSPTAIPMEGPDPGREYLELTVRDSGPGMDDTTRERAFEPFFTTRAHGSGMGLSTVYGIVTQADGAVSLESGPRGGATVRIHLPTTDAGTAGGAAGAHSSSAVGSGHAEDSAASRSP